MLERPSDHEQKLAADLRDSVAQLPALKPEKAASKADRIWQEFRQSLRDSIASKDPRSFLHWEEIIYTMFVNDQTYIAEEFQFLRASKRWDDFWKGLLGEDLAGCPPLRKDIPTSSGNLIHHAYHLEQFADASNVAPWEFESVFEFGGGYGGMCRIFLRLGFPGSYTILDFPEFIALQRYYLSLAGLNTRSVKWIDSVEALSDRDMDSSLVIATWSLSETPRSVRDRFIQLAGKPKAWLIGYQQSFGELDNREFFREVVKTLPEYDWHSHEISHLRGNTYLFGTKRDQAHD